MPDVLERLKTLLNSSTPIVVLETVEEIRAVRLVHAAASPLNLAVFEWTIASGLVRCENNAGAYTQRFTPVTRATPNYSAEPNAQAIYNSRDPSQALSNLEAISTEAVFILKDFHRHMADPVVVRKLRDVGQKFSTNRRTVVITRSMRVCSGAMLRNCGGRRRHCQQQRKCSKYGLKMNFHGFFLSAILP